MYKILNGLIITQISAIKLAYKKSSSSLFKDYLVGYFKAKNNKIEYLVTKKQGAFIRKLRWKGMLGKLK
jgi:hypothetical protein